MATSAQGPASTVPEWLTKEFFVDAIASKLSLPAADFTITELDVKPATAVGDNYASVLYRVRVTVVVHGGADPTATAAVSLIVKAQPNLGLTDEIVQSMNLFPKEMGMYATLLPAFTRLYAERGRDVTFGPRCLKLCSEPMNVIVLEDMLDREFCMADRRHGLEMDHCRMVLRRLALLHAASAVYCERTGPYDDIYQKGMFSEDGRALSEQFQKVQDEFMYTVMSGWSAKGKFYAELMKQWGMDMFEVIVRVTRASRQTFNVLNHGDMWCNNLLFHHDDKGDLDDIVLIDYQLSFWCSPAIDLLYFMCTSVNGNERFTQMDYLVHYYHKHLVRELTFLEYSGEIPTLPELHSDLIAHHLYGFVVSFSILPMVLMEKTDDASMDLMLDQGDAGLAFKLKMYNNPAYVRQMEQIMDYFYNSGAFDILGLGTQQPAGIECDAAVQLPVWLTRDFIQDLVNRNFTTGDRVAGTVRSAFVRNTTQKNDTSSPALYSVRVTLFHESPGTEELVSFVIKAPPKGNTAAYARDKDAYVREQQLYDDLLSEFEQMYRTRGDCVTFGPRSYRPRAGLPYEVIVLEDLSASGYRMVASPCDGLDKQHTEAVLDHMAKFHAASAVFRELGGFLPKELREGCCAMELAKATDQHLSPTLDRVFAYLKDLDFAEQYVEDLETATGHVFSSLLDTASLDADAFCVLNHGQMELRNLLFAYAEGGTVGRVALIDYRNAAWGSPAFDLIHFLFSSVSLDLKLSQQAHFLRYYQEKLARHLLCLGYSKPLPTLQKLHIDFNKRLFAAIKTTLIDLPKALAVPVDESVPESPSEKPLFTNGCYGDQMKLLLPVGTSRSTSATNAGLPKTRRRNASPSRLSEISVSRSSFTASSAMSLASASLEAPRRKMVNISWLDDGFLSGVLATTEAGFSRLVSYEVALATKKGDNYASDMYRVAVHYETGAGETVRRNLILKVMPSGELQQQVMEENSIYPRETVIYREILPKVYALLRSIGDPTIISPICLSTESGGASKQMLVFEDAREQGFQMVDRRFGLDLEQARLVMVKLAKLHACSSILYESDPQLFELTLEGCISDNPKKQSFLPYYRLCVQQVIRLVREWNAPEEWNVILEKLEQLEHKIIPYGCEVYRRDESSFNVLNHNDIWVNNMMFRYGREKGNLEDVLLLDYQLSFYGSPGLDLNFFLFGSLTPEVRSTHMPELVQVYHATLRNTLERLHYRGSIPSLPDVHVELIRKGFHRVNATFQMLPIALMENSEEAEMDLLLAANKSGEALRRQLFDNPRYITSLRKVLPELHRSGYLD
ncbi:uncharacterized protein LOC131207058 [Anopheles bellator]|uniref:uncharacterized protein LOC131207058 n=1 Tax=Anopheles bellator TaxID=139047 RepID=UPI002649A274|nr:uncharacterized protein LOC131207058 [Anopheles bellator]